MGKHGDDGDRASDQRPPATTAAVAASHEGLLRPLKPLAMMPTPASTSSTASTTIMYSPSGSDSDEEEAFLSKQHRKKKSRKHNRSLSHQKQQQQQYRHTHMEDLEYGDRSSSDKDESPVAVRNHEWQVLREYSHCIKEHGVLEVVHLKRANYGFRWRGDDSTPMCMVGPHWWLMASTFTVFTVVALVITVLTLPKSGFGEAITGILLSTACLSMYAMVGCANPGIVQRIDVAPDDTFSYCDQCDSYRPQGALHCMDCRVCIEGYDHHCPWTGKCIGKGNVRYFYAWLFFLVLAFVYEVIEFTTYIMPPEDQPNPSYYDDLTFAPANSSP